MMNVIRIESGAPVADAARVEPELSLVAPAAAGERARQLMAQARAVSLEHLKALHDTLVQAQALSEAVVHAGDLYVPGLNDFTRRLGEELAVRSRTLEALTERQRLAAHGGGR